MAYKRQLAYAHLGIDPRDVEHVPFFAADLRRIARLLNRPRRSGDQAAKPVCVFECLQYSSDPDVLKVLNLYRSVPASYRRLLAAEAFCHAAGVSPQVVLANIAAGAVRINASAAAIVAAVMHPRVVAKTVERALQNDGVRDRMMLFKAMGFLPMRLSNLSAESSETRDSIA
jgi:hypothetical protein